MIDLIYALCSQLQVGVREGARRPQLLDFHKIADPQNVSGWAARASEDARLIGDFPWTSESRGTLFGVA